MMATWLLTKRSIREVLRLPEATVPLLFIPVFFLLVNTGALSDQFKDAPFLKGQDYVAFQLPISLLFSVTGAGSGFALVVDIENGYFDKLLVAPIGRTAILIGRMAADFARNLVMAGLVVLLGVTMGARIETGILGAVLIVLLIALFGVAYAGLSVVIALHSRNAQTVNLTSIMFFPLLFLAPNFLPRENMQGWLERAATYNPVTYVIEGVRSLVINGWEPDRLLYALVVIAVLGVGLLALSVRMLRTYND